MEKWIIKKFSQRKIATKERKTETMTGIVRVLVITVNVSGLISPVKDRLPGPPALPPPSRNAPICLVMCHTFSFVQGPGEVRPA